MKTALVTGSSGFVGRHIVKSLEDGGYRVSRVDIAHAAPVDARHFFENSSTRFDVVIHAAAVVGGRAKIDGDPLALAVNLELDAAMFRWAARTKPRRVIYLSSSAAYPVKLQTQPHSSPLREDDINLSYPSLPDQLYGWAKLTGEWLAKLARYNDVAVSVTRPFSGYGEDQSADYPFPSFAARALTHEDPFTIWGSGDQVRDWIHIDDICAAIMAIITNGIDGPVNLGTGRGISMKELAMMMCREAGYSPRFSCLPGKPAGVLCRVADTSFLRSFYSPRISPEEGVKRAIARRG